MTSENYDKYTKIQMIYTEMIRNYFNFWFHRFGKVNSHIQQQ